MYSELYKANGYSFCICIVCILGIFSYKKGIFSYILSIVHVTYSKFSSKLNMNRIFWVQKVICAKSMYLLRQLAWQDMYIHITYVHISHYGRIFFIFVEKLWSKNATTMSLPNNITVHMIKGQFISKWFFEVVDFLQKTNENNSHSSRNEFISSFFGGNQWPQKPFQNYVAFQSIWTLSIKVS